MVTGFVSTPTNKNKTLFSVGVLATMLLHRGSLVEVSYLRGLLVTLTSITSNGSAFSRKTDGGNSWEKYATRGLLATDHVILNHGQVTWTAPELALPSPNYHTTPTGGRFSSRQI
ncbi:hypothetical protein TNCV_381041 [Trichonephila clavipes]|uniref:Uncharacterized protein n=1 Tax=Trichonephila clavipes TaxID=2585209 RepID=A0A8X6VJJ5_TRICX|nr:hypothetical protein TNCV_381041 [Trichonephila clavipes]